jgi:hypothetical protein
MTDHMNNEMPALTTTPSMNGSPPVEASAPSRTPRSKTSGKKTVPGHPGVEESATPAAQAVATRSLDVVLRAVERHQARSIMLTRLAHVALEEFHGTECHPPTKLVRLPNGIRYAVEPDDAAELYLELLRMAGEERSQLQAIHAAAVQVEPSAVDLPATAYVPGTAPLDDPASTVDNPAHRVAMASPAPRGVASGTRPAKPVMPDEWAQAVGASSSPSR